MPSPVIEVHGLGMSYGPAEVLAGFDLEVHSSEVFAFLGPNGAGKTTTVEILEGFRRRTAGEVSVLGIDPATAGGDWRARIGVVLQECQPEPELTVEECMSLYASYYPRSRARSVRRWTSSVSPTAPQPDAAGFPADNADGSTWRSHSSAIQSSCSSMSPPRALTRRRAAQPGMSFLGSVISERRSS